MFVFLHWNFHSLLGQCMQLNSCECGNLGIRNCVLYAVVLPMLSLSTKKKQKCILQLSLSNGLPLVHSTRGLCYHICVNVSGTLSFTKIATQHVTMKRKCEIFPHNKDVTEVNIIFKDSKKFVFSIYQYVCHILKT